MTGTSVIGMKYKDGVIFAADTGGCFLWDFILFVVFFFQFSLLYYSEKPYQESS